MKKVAKAVCGRQHCGQTHPLQRHASANAAAVRRRTEQACASVRKWRCTLFHSQNRGKQELFTIYNNTETGSTVISNLFIDEYMKDANDAQIKVYLYLLRQMGQGRAASIAEIADTFNHTEKDVLRSLRYWEQCGLMKLDYDSERNLTGIHLLDPSPAPRTAQAVRQDDRVISIAPALEARSAARSAENAAAAETGSRGRQSERASSAVESSALEEFRADRRRQDLLFIIEQYIGKPLSSTELRTICYIAENLHFSDELIDYLVQYCVDLGKKDFRYIEKVAIGWSERGISTTKQAQEQSDRRTVSRKAANRTCGSFGDFRQNQYDFAEMQRKLVRN